MTTVNKPIRLGQIIRLKPEMRDEYIQLHAETWPPVLRAIERAGIRRYSIFLREPEMLLFATFEYWGDDFASDMKAMGEDPEVQRWWARTAPCQAQLDSASAGEWWVSAQEVFFHP